MSIVFDTRERLIKPIPSVVRIVNKQNRNIFATGTIIHSKQILTAAHVCDAILGQGGIQNWEVIAGEHGGFGYPPRQIKRAAMMPLYRGAILDKFTRDIGVITITDTYDPSLVTEFGEFDSETFSNQIYSWVGYPSDKIPSERDVYQWHDYGKPDSLDYFSFYNQPGEQGERRWVVDGYFKNLAAQGQSGSALINESGKIIGVLSSLTYDPGPHYGQLVFGLIDEINFEFIYYEIMNNLEDSRDRRLSSNGTKSR